MEPSQPPTTLSAGVVVSRRGHKHQAVLVRCAPADVPYLAFGVIGALDAIVEPEAVRVEVSVVVVDHGLFAMTVAGVVVDDDDGVDGW
jgi:hypothetical protein